MQRDRGREELPRPGFILCATQGKHIQQMRDRLTGGQEQREVRPEREGTGLITWSSTLSGR